MTNEPTKEGTVQAQSAEVDRPVRRYTRMRLGTGQDWAVFLCGKFIGVIGLSDESGLYDAMDWYDGSFASSKTIRGCMEWLRRA